MSIEISVTVAINGNNRTGTVTFTEDRYFMSGNPKFHATEIEDALVSAGRSILGQVIKLYGDIRDDNPEFGGLTSRTLKRVLTEARS